MFVPGALVVLLALVPQEPSYAETVLRRINEHRKSASLDPIAEDKELSAGCALHARYLVDNFARQETQGAGAFKEDKTFPGYSEAGERAATRSFVWTWIEGEGPAWRVDAYMGMLSARPTILSPTLARVGIGCLQGKNGVSAFVLDPTGSDFRLQPKVYPVIFPAPDQKGVPILHALGAGESPDPRPDKDSRSGYPVTVLFYVPFWHPGDSLLTLSAFGKEVPGWLSTPEKPAVPGRPQKGVVAFLPREPLSPGTSYTATFKCRQIGIEKTPEWTRAWTFTTAAVAPGPKAAPEKRTPAPDAAVMKETEKRVREVYKSDYADKGAAERRAFARKLLQQGVETRDDMAAKYVLLRESREISLQAGDPEGALAAIQALARQFAMDGIAMKAQALAAMARTAKTPDDQKRFALLQLRLAEEACAAEEFAAAQQAATAAAALARQAKDTPLAARAEAYGREASALREAAAKATEAWVTLSVNAGDAAACLTLGRYYCLTRDEWDTGLPLLARSSDAALKDAAMKDLLRPSEPAEQVTVGDLWFDLAEKASGGTREALRRRARRWYDAGLRGLSGFNRARVEKRLTEIRWDRLKGNWMDVDPSLFGKPKTADAIVVSPKPEGAASAMIEKLSGDYTGFSARVRFDPERRTHAGILFHDAQKLWYLQADTRHFASARLGEKMWDIEFNADCGGAEEFTLTILLQGGEYVLYLDGDEKTRVAGGTQRLGGLALFACYASARFDQVRLRKKE